MPKSRVLSPEEERVRRRVWVYDCRTSSGQAGSRRLETTGVGFTEFLQALHQEFKISAEEKFVLVTTDRVTLDSVKFEKLPDESTLYLLQREDQALSVATEEYIKYLPHYDTMIRSGHFEYYASEGQKPLPYTLAELIDNALSATAKNTGVRTIEIRLLFDETLGKPSVVVLDNGCGMTSKQLNNWAVLRLSKFSRDNSTLDSKEEGYVRPDPVPRSLNSDISYFGVGGKHAVFYIGESTRMISKSLHSPDVHELILAKEDFERKEKNKEEIYSGVIRNRKPGDSSHIDKDEEHFLHALIAEEAEKESFTAVVITGVLPEHIDYLREDFGLWTRKLAQVYHYYIHGVNGNYKRNNATHAPQPHNIDIQITMRDRPSRSPHVLNLRDVDDDMQTLYINAAADTFNFWASTLEDGGTVEGVIRYYPFLYDKETYPEDPDTKSASIEDDDDNNMEAGVVPLEREKRKIFDCFWNGRLIPYTRLFAFDWCAYSKGGNVPPECYRRFSGALFTDDRFQVSTNKLTFMDLDQKLRSKDTIFKLSVNGQEKNNSVQVLTYQVSESERSERAALQIHSPVMKKQRSNISNDFKKWLLNCHEKFDKQVKFLGYKETITRPEVKEKKMQHPWATFTSIEWDGKVYKKGQLVKSLKTQPIMYGTVVRFLLYGEHDKDVFANGGQVEIDLEPRALHDKTKTIPISKIDKAATVETIKKNIEKESAKLPEELKVEWPEQNPWSQNDVIPAGTPLGPLQVDIMNKNGESLSRMPTLGQGPVTKLIIDLKIVKHGPPDEEVIHHVGQYSAKWRFWFKRMESLTKLGSYTLYLTTAINETNATTFGGRQLPSYELMFSIKEGPAEHFTVGVITSSVRVGMPFNIPLLIKDCYDHPVNPPPHLKPQLKCSGLDLSYEKVDSSGTTLNVRGVRARGKVPNYQSKTYDMKVTLPGMKQETQTIKINILPGKPHSLHVTPKENPITVENGKPVMFNVEVHDEAGNITANPKQMISCQVQGLPNAGTDCSTGAGQILTRPINLEITNGEPRNLKACLKMPGQQNVAPVEKQLKVLPSTRVTSMAVYSKGNGDLELKNNEKIEWVAGGSLDNLFYKLSDEAGREVSITAEIASRIKVNWTGDVDLKDLVQGKLPDVQVPTQVKDKHFYQVSYQDQSVSLSFHIEPIPDEPKRLRPTLVTGSVRLGQTLAGNITLELVDQFDNVTKTLTSSCVNQMTVEAEGLDKSAIKFEWQEKSSSVLVTGIKFQSGIPGSREIFLTYGNYVERVLVKVTAGVPAQLKLVSGPQQPLQVLNDQGIPTPFVIQLCDQWGNPSPDQRVVVELRSSPQTLKVAVDVTSQPVNIGGKAIFTVSSVSGPKGYYQLEFRGSFNRKPIPGPSVTLTVIPDPKKPVSLSVEYDTDARFAAGGKFPVFSVTVVSDEGSPITTISPGAVSMFCWSGAAAGKVPPPRATVLKCSPPLINDKDDCFHFRDKEIPHQVGKYYIQFSLSVDKAKTLLSNQISIDVVANHPVKLVPESQPPAPVVSYSKDVANRTLVEDMTLMIKDSYGNPAGKELNGKVLVSMKNFSGNNNTLPLFDGKSRSCQYDLTEGKAHITRLTIMANSPGENGGSYVLLFQPEVLMVPLDPYELPFHFYNDEESKQKISRLSMRKEKLTSDIKTREDVISASRDLMKSLTDRQRDACRKESELREKLNNMNVKIAANDSVADIKRCLMQKTTEAKGIEEAPRRVCSIQDPFRGQPDVLGKVGHLAVVLDDAASWVISWHIRGDMDCVITRTTEAAQRIYRDTRGAQQVMALDSVLVRQGDSPLPHIRIGRMLFDPPGNPVYARHLLIFPKDPESCITVFKNLLGDTILMDDLDSANHYRRTLVQHKIPCPTILTRQGDRLSAKGKFGGAQNKAPARRTLEEFGAPYPPKYHELTEQRDVLQQYLLALEKRNSAQQAHADHLKTMKSPDTAKKHQQLDEARRELDEINRQLDSTPKRPVKRRSGLNSGEACGIVAKRTKQM